MSEIPAKTRWSAATKVVVSVSLLGLAVYLLTQFSEVIPPFVLAIILAFILSPIVDRMQARIHLPRGLITAIVYLLLLAILSLLVALLIPALANQIRLLNLDLQDIVHSIEIVFGKSIVVGGYAIDVGRAIDQALTGLQTLLEPIFGQTLGIVVEAITSVVWVIFILVISFYLIKDGHQLWAWIERQVPPSYQLDYHRLRQEIYGIWRDFFRGQLILALVVSVIFTVAGLIIGLPFSLAMAVLAGLLEFIPSLGHAIWLVIAVVLTLFQGSTWIPVPNLVFALIVVGLHLVYQQVDLNYLIPRIIGRSVRLHPLVVILGIVAGATLAGVLGIVLAAPTIASARVLGRYIRGYLVDEGGPVVPTPSSGSGG
ncbi:MAG: AI-2E family transporter [Anaerolineales bacterium]|jgi:predicted PurR-regulated permease PerM